MANSYKLDLESQDLNSNSKAWHRKEVISEVSIDNVSTASTDDDDDDSESIEDKLNDENFITPQEYYSSLDDIVTEDKTQQGFHRISNSGDTSDRKWFWSDDLKNWCSYKVSMNRHEAVNSFQLQVWNGKDGWMDILFSNDQGVNEFRVNQAQDSYSIRKFQHNLIDTLVYGTYDTELWGDKSKHKNTLEINRGWCAAVFTKYGNTLWDTEKIDSDAFYNQGPLLTVYGFKLQKSTKYTTNMPGTFQTIRWSTIAGNNSSDGKNYSKIFGQTNAVWFIPTGSPTLWRLPTGDLFLATILDIKADNGDPYVYMMDKKAGGFKKVYESSFLNEYDKHVSEYRMMGDNDEAAANWINKICASFFGDGNDKTIDNDWLRQDAELITEIQNTEQGQSDQYDMLDTNKIYEQNNINKENSLQCKFVVNRPVVTSEETGVSDYVKQW